MTTTSTDARGRVRAFMAAWRERGGPDNGSIRLLGSRESGIELYAQDVLDLVEAPPSVWWLDLDSELTDPEVFRTEDAAKADAIRVYREANDLTAEYLGWLGKELPDFAWREHRDGGTELYVDAEATGLIVRQLTVKDAHAAVSVDG